MLILVCLIDCLVENDTLWIKRVKNGTSKCKLSLDLILLLLSQQSVVLSMYIIGYGSTLTLTDTSNKIKEQRDMFPCCSLHNLMAAVPAIIDHVRDGVVKKLGI